MRRGQGVVRAIQKLLKDGFLPDIVCTHQGWGEALYLKDVLPGVPVLSYCKFYYHGRGASTLPACTSWAIWPFSATYRCFRSRRRTAI